MKLRSRGIFYGGLLLALVLFGWWKLSSDPRSAFLADVDGILEMANTGEHLSIRKKFSPEAEERIGSSFMTVPQALFLARKEDTEKNIRYRRAGLGVFYPRDYAEVEIERSGPGNDFSNSKIFPVPFLYRKGQWLVAGEFRGERDFSNPFE